MCIQCYMELNILFSLNCLCLDHRKNVIICTAVWHKRVQSRGPDRFFLIVISTWLWVAYCTEDLWGRFVLSVYRNTVTACSFLSLLDLAHPHTALALTPLNCKLLLNSRQCRVVNDSRVSVSHQDITLLMWNSFSTEILLSFYCGGYERDSP